jgi:hypothetical protein
VSTLGQAQLLVRESTVTKTVYLRAGTYNQNVTFVLTAADDGETWSTYPGDAVGSAILDYSIQSFNGTYAQLGAPNGCAWMILGASNLTLDGLTFQNFPAIGVLGYGGNAGSQFGFMTNVATLSGIRIVNCSFINGGYGAFPPWHPGNDGQNVASGGGIYPTESPMIWLAGAVNNGTDVSNATIANNYFYKHSCTPIVLQRCAASVSNNYIQEVNKAAFDTGVIYTQFASGVSITYNYIRDGKGIIVSESGDSDRDVRAIYCDYSSDNITAQFNVIAGGVADTSGLSPTFDDTYRAFMFGQGPNANQIFNYNIIDIGTVGHVVFQNSSTGSGNQFVGNIIISNFSGNPRSPSYGAWYLSYSNGTSTPTAPTCGPNAYHNYGGGSVYTNGDINGSPVVSDSDPQSVDPMISGWAYDIDPTSPVFSGPIDFPALPSNWGQAGFWGPFGFVIPTTGTSSVPSCPH